MVVQYAVPCVDPPMGLGMVWLHVNGGTVNGTVSVNGGTVWSVDPPIVQAWYSMVACKWWYIMQL